MIKTCKICGKKYDESEFYTFSKRYKDQVYVYKMSVCKFCCQERKKHEILHCKKCKTYKPKSDFNTQKGSKTGYYKLCTKCMNNQLKRLK
jgi:hypothetical protein